MRSWIGRTVIMVGVVGWTMSHRAHGTLQRPKPTAAMAADWRTPHESAGTLALERGWQGHFFVNGDIVGEPLRFMIDTGASTVALSRADARAAGVDVDHLAYDGRAATASGEIAVARVTLPAVRIGDIQILDVRAMVMNVDEGMPLLGQSFLARIDKVSIEGDTMTLTKL